MADREALYTALRNADAAGDAEGARKLATYIQSMPKDDAPADRFASISAGRATGNAVLQNVGNLVAGVSSGFADVGNTVLNAAGGLARRVLSEDDLSGLPGVIKGGERRNAERNAGLKSFNDEHNDSTVFTVGRIGGNVAATYPVGGALGAALRTVAPSLATNPLAAKVVESIASNGFRTGAPAATTLAGKSADMGIRAAGGTISGAATAGLIDPHDALTGAVVGGLLPPALAASGRVGGYVGRTVNALAQPYTQNGQIEIAGNILKKFAKDGPSAINSTVYVPGSVPTLAEATGNAGLARLQSAARDLRPNAFVEREALNSAARNAAFDNVAGDASELAFHRASRSTAADELYGVALNRAPEPLTPYLKGQITQLLKRPSIDDASRVAQKWAIERGEKPAEAGSLRALHDVKTALDDKISEAVRSGAGGEASALQATKDKLLDVMEKLSPEYAEARITYAEMSKPINAMESLQGLKLTDARGNMTLSKVQNAISGLEKLRSAPGVNPAKSVSAEQLNVLTAIRDDLLRQSNLAVGKSAGSNTFQNIATDNLLSTMLPGKLGGMVNSRIGDAVGQVGKLAYSGPNEKIRNKLLDLMLDPAAAQTAMNPAAPQIGMVRSRLNALADRSAPWLYRSAPALLSDQ